MDRGVGTEDIRTSQVIAASPVTMTPARRDTAAMSASTPNPSSVAASDTEMLRPRNATPADGGVAAPGIAHASPMPPNPPTMTPSATKNLRPVRQAMDETDLLAVVGTAGNTSTRGATHHQPPTFGITCAVIAEYL